jgi:DivIVA domain-containing protein
MMVLGLEGGAGMELTARMVEDKRFSTSMRGYSKEDVDTFVSAIASQVSKLEQQLTTAEVKTQKAQEELDHLRDGLDAKHAEIEAARIKIIEESQREAASIATVAGSMEETGASAGAVKTAAAIVAEAETKAALRLQDLDAMKTEATDKAARIVKAAEETATLREAEADRVLDAARRQARSMHAESEIAKSEIEDQLVQLRKILVAAQAGDSDELTDANVILRNGNEIVIDLSERSHVPESTA